MNIERHLILQTTVLWPSGEWSPPSSGWVVVRVGEGFGYWLQAGQARELQTGDGFVASGCPGMVIRASQLGNLRLEYYAIQTPLLNGLLTVAEGNRSSRLDQLRSGPVMVSGPALIRALRRLDDVRGIGITLPAAAHIPPSRIAALARFANTAKVTAINRLPASRRMATLVAFALCLEATAHDDALEVLEALLRERYTLALRRTLIDPYSPGVSSCAAVGAG